MNESFFNNNLEEKDKKSKNNNSLWIIVFVWTLIIISNIIIFYSVDRYCSVIAIDLLSICFTILYLRREWQKNNDKTKLTLKVLIKIAIILTVFFLVLYLLMVAVFVPFNILFIPVLPFLAILFLKTVDRLFNISTAKKARKELTLLVFLGIIYITLFFVLNFMFSPETAIF
ncbi:hypothetical protein D4R86_04650 [bacterium]|nr:MAG: hypothetical protein D4R86_04650 [bacterium]